MDNKKFLEQLECTGIVPVIKLENTADAVNLAKALYDGGIRCAEVTFRAEGADKVGELSRGRSLACHLSYQILVLCFDAVGDGLL